MAHATETPTFTIKNNTFDPIQWLLRFERAYREAQQLKSTENHHLKDMGITRREADAVFLTRYSQNRHYAGRR